MSRGYCQCRGGLLSEYIGCPAHISYKSLREHWRSSSSSVNVSRLRAFRETGIRLPEYTASMMQLRVIYRFLAMCRRVYCLHCCKMYWSQALLFLTSFPYSAIGSLLPLPHTAEPILDGRPSQSEVSVTGSNSDLILQQDQLNETNTIVECTDHPIWFRSWTDHMEAKYFEAACVSAWQNMVSIEVVPHGSEKFEFLSEHASPARGSSQYRPMRTPRRYTASTFCNYPRYHQTLIMWRRGR